MTGVQGEQQHSRAGSRARNICTRSQIVILLTGNVFSTDNIGGGWFFCEQVNFEKKGWDGGEGWGGVGGGVGFQVYIELWVH